MSLLYRAAGPMCRTAPPMHGWNIIWTASAGCLWKRRRVLRAKPVCCRRHCFPVKACRRTGSNAASRDTASSETEGRKEQGADPAVNGPDRAPGTERSEEELAGPAGHVGAGGRGGRIRGSCRCRRCGCWRCPHWRLPYGCAAALCWRAGRAGCRALPAAGRRWTRGSIWNGCAGLPPPPARLRELAESKVQQSCADTGGAWGADRICRPMRGPTGERERAAAPFLGKMDLMPVLTAKRKEKASEWSMSKLQRR